MDDTVSSDYPSVLLLVACENETVVKLNSLNIVRKHNYQIESDTDLN